MGASSVTAVAQPLDPTDIDLPEATQDILEKGKRSWLKNTEVCDMLINYAAFNLRVAREPPCKPPGSQQAYLHKTPSQCNSACIASLQQT